jgi:hypothetical protein
MTATMEVIAPRAAEADQLERLAGLPVDGPGGGP